MLVALLRHHRVAASEIGAAPQLPSFGIDRGLWKAIELIGLYTRKKGSSNKMVAIGKHWLIKEKILWGYTRFTKIIHRPNE